MGSETTTPAPSGRQRKRSHRDGSRLCHHLELATETLIYAILLFTPWAFGTTEHWAIQSVNIWNYLLGALLVAKWVARRADGFTVERWDAPSQGRWLLFALAGLSIFLLGHCAIAAWNARADFLPAEQRFQYFDDYIPWLPHSYDRSSTWAAFQLYLAAACFFWALRDWLITKSPADLRSETQRDDLAAANRFRFPARLSRLIWLISINGAILALEGTLQRLSGTNELLWLVKPRFNDAAFAQFGPFNYRTNGAQYLNMIWPLTLGFWWALHRQRTKKLGEGAEFLLLPLAGMIMAAPIIATSRGGIAIAVGQALAVAVALAYTFRKTAWKAALAVGLVVIVVASSAALDWNRLKSRFTEKSIDTLGGRTEIYENAERIANDFPIWGVGPKTFSSVYLLYRTDPNQMWFAQAHNDFLETRVTFGRVGLLAILAAVTLAFSHWFFSRGISVPPLFVLLLAIGAAGVLVHARFDFPFQIYSLLLTFLTLCAILCAVGRK